MKIKLEFGASAQVEALEEGNGWFYPDDAGNISEIGKNATNLISDSCDLFGPLFSNWCHGSANFSGVQAH